jgi:hypothetical protein
MLEITYYCFAWTSMSPQEMEVSGPADSIAGKLSVVSE